MISPSSSELSLGGFEGLVAMICFLVFSVAVGWGGGGGGGGGGVGDRCWGDGSGVFRGGDFSCFTIGSGGGGGAFLLCSGFSLLLSVFFSDLSFSVFVLLLFSFGLELESLPESLLFTSGDMGFFPFLLGVETLGDFPFADDPERCDDLDDGLGGEGEGEEN